MSFRFLLYTILFLIFSTLTFAQDSPSPPVSPYPSDSVTLDDAQLQTLLAPIALYPDPLIAQILPASTYPVQIVDSERWLTANPNPPEQAIDAQPFEPPIKALIHYPTVLAMMNQQLDWTQSLGVAFINQQSDVMNAIQELRHQAQAAGSLQTTPQQQVVSDDGEVDIVPANPDVVYVPQYDPAVVYVGGGPGVYFTWGVGFPEGIWLDGDIDWHHHWVERGDGWHHGWDHPGDSNGGRPWGRNPAQALPVRSRPPEPMKRPAPGYDDHKAQAPARGAFDGYGNRADVQRSDQRASESHPAPPARPAPQPAPRAAPPQAFHAEGNGHAVAAQSARGNASRGGGGGASHGGGRK